MPYALQIDSVSKQYAPKFRQDGVLALNNVSLNIKKGTIFGLLGPNGAGKSTLINILCGLVAKTSGKVFVDGYDIDQDLIAAKYSIGIVQQELVLDPYFTPFEVLELQAGLYGVKPKDRITEQLLESLNLTSKAKSYARSLSGGMKRRLMVAKAMVHQPKILVLDEPTAGVDVELRHNLWNFIKDLNQKGTTIIFSTHYLEEAESLCREIAIIDRGRLLISDKTENLVSKFDKKQLNLTLTEPMTRIPEELKEFECNLLTPKLLTIHYQPSQHSGYDILKRLNKLNLGIREFSTKEADLEDIFLQLTARSR